MAVCVQVLVATSTLAWGVNTPAHLVIIKGTEFFDAPTRCCTSFPHGADIQGWFCLCRHVKAMIAAAPHSTPNQELAHLKSCLEELLMHLCSNRSSGHAAPQGACPQSMQHAWCPAVLICALIQTLARPEGACTCRFLDTHSLYTAVRRYQDIPVTDTLHLRGLMLKLFLKAWTKAVFASRTVWECTQARGVSKVHGRGKHCCSRGPLT